jgi:hypothetical protein
MLMTDQFCDGLCGCLSLKFNVPDDHVAPWLSATATATATDSNILNPGTEQPDNVGDIDPNSAGKVESELCDCRRKAISGSCHHRSPCFPVK